MVIGVYEDWCLHWAFKSLAGFTLLIMPKIQVLGMFLQHISLFLSLYDFTGWLINLRRSTWDICININSILNFIDLSLELFWSHRYPLLILRDYWSSVLSMRLTNVLNTNIRSSRSTSGACTTLIIWIVRFPTTRGGRSSWLGSNIEVFCIRSDMGLQV